MASVLIGRSDRICRYLKLKPLALLRRGLFAFVVLDCRVDCQCDLDGGDNGHDSRDSYQHCGALRGGLKIQAPRQMALRPMAATMMTGVPINILRVVFMGFPL